MYTQSLDPSTAFLRVGVLARKLRTPHARAGYLLPLSGHREGVHIRLWAGFSEGHSPGGSMCLPGTFAAAPARVTAHPARGAGYWQWSAVTFLWPKGKRGRPTPDLYVSLYDIRRVLAVCCTYRTIIYAHYHARSSFSCGDNAARELRIP